MSALAEQVGEEILSDILAEAADELHGRSTRRWGVALVAILLGLVIAIFVVKRRSRQLASEIDTPLTEPSPPMAAAS